MKIKRTDIILFFAALVIFGGLFFFIRTGNPGGYVSVYVDGEFKGKYLLSEDNIIKIDSLTGPCTLKIENGEAYMTEASCPDRLCIMQQAISHSNETIVCLPGRVVVKVEGNKKDDVIDAIVQ